MTIISLIVAVAQNNVIGHGNELPWDIPEDMQWFREKTRGKPVIMGRKTFESIGAQQKPEPKPGFLLPKRPNIIITRKQEFTVNGATIVHSLEDALALPFIKDYEEAFVIGGGEIYKLALEKNLIDRVYITDIERDVEGDAVLVGFDQAKWALCFEDPRPEKGTTPAYTFRIYEKKAA